MGKRHTLRDYNTNDRPEWFDVRRRHIYQEHCEPGIRTSAPCPLPALPGGSGLEPLDGGYYVFLSRRRTQLAVVHFDGSSWCTFRKRLERGTVDHVNVSA